MGISKAKYCADCGVLLNYDGHKDGWQLEDGRIVCHSCCVKDFKKLVCEIIDFYM